jgi:hypothetical protein
MKRPLPKDFGHYENPNMGLCGGMTFHGRQQFQHDFVYKERDIQIYNILDITIMIRIIQGIFQFLRKMSALRVTIEHCPYP